VGWSASNSSSSSSSQASSSPSPNYADISALATWTGRQRTAEISLRSNRASSTVTGLGIISGFFGGRRRARACRHVFSSVRSTEIKIETKPLYRLFLTTVPLHWHAFSPQDNSIFRPDNLPWWTGYSNPSSIQMSNQYSREAQEGLRESDFDRGKQVISGTFE
jgi:hypothetical protein